MTFAPPCHLSPRSPLPQVSSLGITFPMPPPLPVSRRPTDAAGRRRSACVLLLAAASFASLFAFYAASSSAAPASPAAAEGNAVECCRGVEGLELWGAAVKWGANHRADSAAACCAECRAMCGGGGGGRCECDSWVFCGDRERCSDRFGECWLKKQKDVLAPAVMAKGENVMWTSGLIFGKGKGIVGLETNHGTLRIKLLPDCAPHSVAYLIELLRMRHCAGCRFYRAEDRGDCWDSKGDHVKNALFGPPYALLQGMLEADGVPFTAIPREACPPIKRGSVAWVGSGPEFFVSLANHEEFRDKYTVFGSVLPEDMEIAEEMSRLPTSRDVWSNVTVSVLRDPVYFKVKSPTSSNVS